MASVGVGQVRHGDRLDLVRDHIGPARLPVQGRSTRASCLLLRVPPRMERQISRSWRWMGSVASKRKQSPASRGGGGDGSFHVVHIAIDALGCASVQQETLKYRGRGRPLVRGPQNAADRYRHPTDIPSALGCLIRSPPKHADARHLEDLPDLPSGPTVIVTPGGQKHLHQLITTITRPDLHTHASNQPAWAEPHTQSQGHPGLLHHPHTSNGPTEANNGRASNTSRGIARGSINHQTGRFLHSGDSNTSYTLKCEEPVNLSVDVDDDGHVVDAPASCARRGRSARRLGCAASAGEQ